MAKSHAVPAPVVAPSGETSIDVQPKKTRKRKKKPGVRAILKLERRERITAAARELFIEHGYDDATLRQIAAHAGLGLGTLFNYVTDKRDLIFLIWNEEMDALVDRCLRLPKIGQAFEEKILAMTAPQFRVLAKDPKLSRILLSETKYQSPGMHLERYLAIRARLLRGFESLVLEGLKSGEISSRESAEIIARHIFFSFTAEVRWWIESADTDWRSGQAEFARILKLQMDGISPVGGRPTQSRGEPGPKTRRPAY
jgi:AcrR family transcriptional regulator